MDLTVEQILSYIQKLIPPEDIDETEKYFRIPTICHNTDHKSASQKLYLYKNEDTVPLFHCYTECSETFNLYQLIIKYESLRGNKITYREAYKMVHGDTFIPKPKVEQIPEYKYEKQFKSPLSILLPEYPPHALEKFSFKENHPWFIEGIDLYLLEKYNIGYSKSLQAVSIPHLDWRGRLIGVRVRNFEDSKVEKFKYMPLQANNTFYSHPLSLNLFGIFHAQSDIKKMKKVYLFEGEKSVLQYQAIFNTKNALAVCGKSISKWHMDMLIHFLGVEEVIVGFDKEYESYNTAFEFVKRIEKQVEYLSLFCRIGIMIDEKEFFSKNESPVDRSKKEFESMKIWHLE